MIQQLEKYVITFHKKNIYYINMEKEQEQPRTPLNLHNLPTSAEGLQPGDVWNNRGVLNIVSK